MKIQFSTIYNRISDYFLARVHTKDYEAIRDGHHGIQTSSLELDATAKLETAVSFWDGSLGSGNNCGL